MNLVNIVATGSINHELDLNAVHEDIQNYKKVNKSKISSFNLNLGFKRVDGSLLLYSSGKYNIMGCSSVDEVEKTNQLFLDTLSELGVTIQAEPTTLSISNYVYTVDLHRDVNLHKMYSKLNGNVQYEPEQNPFLIYKPDGIECMVTVSNSGKCVMNTSEGRDTILKLKQRLLDNLD
jgi:TATA-box binding protein (TBP) (component of TFIID and TFIIIB)